MTQKKKKEVYRCLQSGQSSKKYTPATLLSESIDNLGIYSCMFIVSLFISLAFGNTCLPFGSGAVHPSHQHSLGQYSTTFLNCSYDNKKVFALRQMNLNNVPTSLVVDAENLETQLITSSCLSCTSLTTSDLVNSSYGRLLESATSAPYPLQNDGIVSGNVNSRNVSLTIDMCPSQKGISQNVYNQIVNIATSTQSAFPVGIAMTQRWLSRYRDHFLWLKELQISGQLKVVWINHSANHFYDRNLPLENNFLLAPNTDFINEVFRLPQNRGRRHGAKPPSP